MKEFKILALDGGGARGLFSVDLLNQIEKNYKIKLTDYFDLIIGTSTGSIIAAGIAAGIELEKIESLYLKEMDKIFKKNPFKNGIFESKYTNTHLKKVLKSVFKNKNFKDVNTDLMITATNIVNGSPVIIKSSNSEGIELVDAILSSCAAPVFFDPVKINEENIFSDGGLWANSPGLIALTEALSTKGYNQNLENIKIMSIGTGEEILKNKYDNKLWGITHWYNPLIKIIMQLSSKTTHNILLKLLKEEMYLRLDYITESVVDIDTIDKDVIKKSRKTFEKNKMKIKKFFEKRKEKRGIIKRIFEKKVKLFK